MVKVAEILFCFHRGGIEAWLKDVAVNYDHENFRIDFILLDEKPEPYDDIVKGAGNNLLYAPRKGGLMKFSRKLYRVLSQEKFDVIHVHLHYFSGWVCFIAFLAGVRVRIAHSHCDTSIEDKKASVGRKITVGILRLMTNIFATKKIACSPVAGDTVFRKGYEIVYCGIDFSRFMRSGDRSGLKAALGIPESSIVVGHAGRFEEQKNHDFLVDIFAEYSRSDPDAFLVMAGDGSLREATEAKVRGMGLKNVLFLGPRDDVDVLMKEVFDIMLLPSLFEGLPVVLMETQAAGLKCLMTDTLAPETTIVDELIDRMSLKEGAKAWADKLGRMLASPRPDYADVARKMQESPFSIGYSVKHLERIYLDSANK